MLELVTFVRFKNSDKNEIIEHMYDTYTEKTFNKFKEVFETLKYSYSELHSLGAISNSIEEIYIELQLHSEKSDDVTILKQYSIS